MELSLVGVGYCSGIVNGLQTHLEYFALALKDALKDVLRDAVRKVECLRYHH